MEETLAQYGLTREDLIHLVEGPWRRLKAVLDKTVVDVHCHNWKPKGVEYVRTMRERARVYQQSEIVDNTEEFILSMDMHGIEKACVNYPTKSRRGTRLQITYDEWLESISRHPDRFVEYVSWPGATEPDKPATKDPLEVARFVRTRLQQDARMIEGEGIFPIYPNADPKSVAPILEAVQEYDVPVHLNMTGTSKAYKAIRQPELYLPYIQAYPTVRFILGDAGGKRFPMGGGWQAIMSASMYDNAFLEISGAPVSIVEMAVRTLGADKVLYASDQSFAAIRYFEPCGGWDAYLQWSTLNAVALADLTEAQQEFILHKNARRLLKLGE